MEIADGVGERVRRRRIEKGLTQAQLGDPYSAAFVSQIETGRRIPNLDKLTLFAKRLGVSVQELATGVAPAVEPEAVLRLQEGWRCLYLGRYSEARRAFRLAHHAAERLHNASLQARAVVGQGRCSEYEGQTSDAMEYYEQARDLFQGSAAPPAAVEAVAGIARCHQMRGATRLALHVLESYLLELELQELPDPSALMRVFASLVWPYTELGLYEKAHNAATHALKLQQAVNSPEEIATMHLNTARALLNNGRSADALESLKKAEEIFRNLNWETEIARAQTNQGIVLTAEGDLVNARVILRAALETYRRVGFVRGEARTLNELARLERLLDNLATGESLARQALELLREMQAIPELALAHRELGLCLAQDDSATAEAHLRQAIALYESCDEIDNAADTHRLLGDLLEGRERYAGVDTYRAGLALISRRLDRRDYLPGSAATSPATTG